MNGIPPDEINRLTELWVVQALSCFKPSDAFRAFCETAESEALSLDMFRYAAGLSLAARENGEEQLAVLADQFASRVARGPGLRP